MAKEIRIDLPIDSYSVKIGKGIIKKSLTMILNDLGEKRVFVITNTTIAGLYPDYIKGLLPSSFEVNTLKLPDGEKYKNLDTLNLIYNFLLKNEADRNSILIAFGGGVIGDITGFAAASFMRGVKFIQVPTTLLAQVDSSVGGKTGVNHPLGKNTIGAFKQPLQTIIDINFLETLSQREITAGYAELFKHSLIYDASLFKTLNQTSLEQLLSVPEKLIDVIYCACKIKATVVMKDEKEENLRAILNFGHTFGHFIETYTHYEKYLHGEAIIAGMDFAAWWSMKYSSLTLKERNLIHQHLKSLDVKIEIPRVERKTFHKIVRNDKKTGVHGVTFVGLKSIGGACLLPKVQLESLWDGFVEYMKQDKDRLINFT